MRNKNKQGFSFVEIIITIAILIILWSVAVTSYDASKNKTYNTKVESHLQHVKTSLTSYAEDTGMMPVPRGNVKNYNVDGAYEHNYTDENTFWASGFLTDGMIEKRYMHYLPLDPRTNQYFAYAKVKKYHGFQLWAVIVNNNEPQTKVVSHWAGTRENQMPYLIKEYNGPRFITHNSKDHFPYNPLERQVIAKIQSYSWTLQINDKTFTHEQILNYTLWQGDKIYIQTWGTIDLYYSDGTHSLLWDITEPTEITLENMKYLEKNNLFTSIKVRLNMGSIWNKAVTLWEKSEFTIETPNATAAVRGTVFWVRHSWPTTNIVVQEGSVEVNTLQGIPVYKPWVSDDNGVIQVEKWGDPKWLEITGTTPTSSIGAIDKIPTGRRDFIQYEEPSEAGMPIYTHGCDEWYEKLNREECEAFINERPEETGTGQIIFDYYKENVKRKPTKKEMERWLNFWWTIEQIKKEINKEVHFNFLKWRERNNIWVLWEEACEAQNSFRINYECVENYLFKQDPNWKVVAFAPYDEDLKMWTGSNLEWGGEVWYSSWYVNSNLFHEPLNSTHNYVTWCNQKSNSDDYANKNTELISLQPKPIFKEEELAIYNLLWTRGLFLDNVDCDDFLSYNINPLNLTWSFAIEMSVRGGALKRPLANWQQHILAQFWDWLCLRTFFYAHNTYLGLTADCQFWSVIKWDNINTFTWKLNDNDFYKIRITNNWFPITKNNTNLSIYDKNWLLIKDLDISTWDPSITTLDNHLYVWSYFDGTNNKFQWNDIIDYVKIYKK